MVRSSPLAAIQNFLVTVADVIDTVYFKLADFLGISRRFGKRLSITYLAVASILAFIILISLIVSIASTASQSKTKGPEPAMTTENAIDTSTSVTSDTVTPDKTQSASVSLTYPHTIVSSKSYPHTTVSSKSTLTSLITTTTNKPQTSPSPSSSTPSTSLHMTSTATQTKPPTSSTRSTRRTSTTTTTKPQTSSSRSTQTQTTTPGTTIKPPETPVHCMFVGDVLNLGEHTESMELYWQEKEMIFQIAESVINWYDSNTVASWAYGHVEATNFPQQFEYFTHEWTPFAEHLAKLMKFENNTISPSGGNKKVFTEINEKGDDNQKANCLVFLSAMTNATGYTIKPKYDYKRIVVVNMAGGDFSKILDDDRGTVVEVSAPYLERENSARVFKAIVEGFLNQ